MFPAYAQEGNKGSPKGSDTNFQAERQDRGVRATTDEITRSAKCAWNVKRKDYIRLDFETIHDVAMFSLENAFLSMDGKTWRQRRGLPMGDPCSPGLTILTCAWMEMEWMRHLSPEVKNRFAMGRYMDDLALLYRESTAWDHSRFVKDLFEREDATSHHSS